MKRIQNNRHTLQLIADLKKQAIEQKTPLWKRIASDLEKPNRQRTEVNVYKIDKYTKDNEIVIVPGKVLGTGDLTHKVTVAAVAFSAEAEKKISSSGTVLTIADLMKKNPTASKVRILG